MKTTLFPETEVKKFAYFNSLRNHRIVLGRIWDSLEKQALVIGLNPSTANETEDDPTIQSVVRILRHNGYGGLWMMNLFTFISSNPKDLARVSTCAYDAKVCVKYWDRYDSGQDIIFAWGNFETFGRDKKAIAKFGDKALCFGKNSNGSPRHPLYLKSTTLLEKWNA